MLIVIHLDWIYLALEKVTAKRQNFFKGADQWQTIIMSSDISKR